MSGTRSLVISLTQYRLSLVEAYSVIVLEKISEHVDGVKKDMASRHEMKTFRSLPSEPTVHSSNVRLVKLNAEGMKEGMSSSVDATLMYTGQF